MPLERFVLGGPEIIACAVVFCVVAFFATTFGWHKEILIHKRKYSSCLIVKRRFLMRDTFAGKILTEIWRPENISEKLSNFYRQKCRAT